MQTTTQLAVCLFLSLAMPACGSKSATVSLRDGAAYRDGSHNVEANEAAGADVASDAATTDWAREASGEALSIGPDSPELVNDAAVTNDGMAGVDLQPFDAGLGEAGVAVCLVGAACIGQTGCSSGDEVDIWCRTMLACQNGSLKPPSHLFAGCGVTAGSPCPATQPGEGTACTLQAQTCSYSTGTCTCATGCERPVDAGPCQKPKTWYCDSPLPAGCPTQAPQLGDPCLEERAICSYGKYCLQYEVICQGGYWEPHGWAAFGGCA